MLNSTCAWDGCDRPVYARGLCQRCNMRARRAGTLHNFRSPDVTCRHCGASYGEGSRAGKWFCSTACQRAARIRTRAERRVAELGERVCGFCQGPVPLARRSDAKHCGVACQQASWYLENEERLRAAARVWAETHTDLRNEHENRRRAKKLSLPYERVDVDAVWNRDGGCCWICSDTVDRDLRFPHPMSRSLDHVIPLSKGGHHVLANVAVAHLRCNISKKDRLLEHLPHWFDSEREEEPGVVTESA